MKKPIIPDNESSRLDALNEYKILDTEAEQEFDDLTALASHISGMPISLVSLVDMNRQWFKSAHGIDATETEREIAFCAHVIAEDTELEVKNALEDVRFHDNPLVTGETHIRYYYGIPIHSHENLPLGTLCCINQQADSLTEDQKQWLRRIAHLVEGLFSKRLKNLELEDTKELLLNVINLEEDAVVVKDDQQKVCLFNHAYRELIPEEQRSELKIGAKLTELFGDENAELLLASDKEALERGDFRRHIEVIGPNNQNLTCLVNKKRFQTSRDKLQVITTISDRTEYQKMLANNSQLEAYLKSITKFLPMNMHQHISAVENLSKWVIEEGGTSLTETSHKYLSLIENRAKKLRNITDQFTSLCSVPILDKTRQKIELSKTASMIAFDLGVDDSFQIISDLLDITIEKSLFELALTCIIDNAYAHHPTQQGQCTITATAQEAYYFISISDDGRGIPEELHERVFEMGIAIQAADAHAGLGLAILERIMGEVDGKVSIDPSYSDGCKIDLWWPITKRV